MRIGAQQQGAQDQEIAIPVGSVDVAGSLSVPAGARGIVVFAHGSGSGRFSVRNRAVAQALLDAGFATLLIDLLTPAEEAEDLRTGRLRFDVRLLAERVIGAIDWLSGDGNGVLPSGLGDLPVGCFGASTGAAAALIAAAERRERVSAVVSRGGRPDLAANALPRVIAPTLLPSTYTKPTSTWPTIFALPLARSTTVPLSPRMTLSGSIPVSRARLPFAMR